MVRAELSDEVIFKIEELANTPATRGIDRILKKVLKSIKEEGLENQISNYSKKMGSESV